MFIQKCSIVTCPNTSGALGPDIDIDALSKQTESIRAQGSRCLNCNWDKMVQSIFLPLSASAALATAVASIVTSDMYMHV